jgi:peptidoglycan/xylan/chitin deacetylase (PgdA/CDA1 family)
MNRFIATSALLLFLTGCSNRAEGSLSDHIGKSTKIVKAEVKVVSQPNKLKQDEEKSDKPMEAIQQPAYRVDQSNFYIRPISNADPKVVLLTFDDAPDKYALEMAKKLKSLNAKAIFFVNGHFLDTPEEKSVLKEIYEMGFTIGNHTYDHANLPDLTEREQRDEIIRVNDVVKEITGEKPVFFRAPFGANTDYSKKLVANEKMVIMNWSFGYDWDKQYESKKAITQIMLKNPYLENGANLLMHDRAWTNDALVDIVKGLKEQGYGFVDPDLIEKPI